MKSFDSEKLWSAFPVEQRHLTKLDAVYIFPHPTHTNSLLNIYEKRQPHFHQLLSGRYALPPAGWAGNQTHIFISISYIPHFCFALKTYPRAGLMIPSHGLGWGEGKASPRQHFIWISHFVQRAADVRILYHFFLFVRSLCLYGVGGAGTVANVVEWLPRGHWYSGRSYDRSRLAVVGLFPEWLIKPAERAAESKLSTKGSLSLVSFFLLRWFLASPFFHLQIHTHEHTQDIVGDMASTCSAPNAIQFNSHCCLQTINSIEFNLRPTPCWRPSGLASHFFCFYFSSQQFLCIFLPLCLFICLSVVEHLVLS